MKNAISCTGGGFKASYYLGCFKAMHEHNIYGDAYFGASAGCLVGSLAAMGKFDVLDKLWLNVGETNGANITTAGIAYLSDGKVKVSADAIQDIVLNGFDVFDKIRLLTKKGRESFIKRAIQNASSIESLMDNTPLFNLLLEHIKEKDFLCPFHFTIVSLESGSLYNLSHESFATDRDLCLAILASSSIPVLWKPINGITLKDGTIINAAVDGGLRRGSTISLSYEHINNSFEWNVWSLGLNSIYQPLNKAPKTLINQAALSIDSMLNENLVRDVKMSTKINGWALKYPEFAKGENIVYAKLHNIECPVDKDNVNLLGSTLDTRLETINSRIKIGYDVMNKYLTENYV